MAIGIGLELAESVVRAAVVERRGSQIRLAASAEVPRLGGDDLASAIRQLRKILPIKQPVILGFPTSWTITATARPLIINPTRRHAEAAIRFELQQQIPYEATQAVWHYQWLGDHGTVPPGRFDAARAAVVAAVKRSVLDERLRACREAGVAVQAVSVSALAVLNAWARRSSVSDEGLALYVDGSLCEWIVSGPAEFRVIPTLLPTRVDRVPIGPTGSGSSSQPAGSLVAVSETMSQEREETLNALKASWMSLSEGREGSGISSSIGLLGDSSSMLNMATELSRVLGHAVDSVPLSQLLSVEASGVSHPERFVVASGLGLQAVGASRCALDLLSALRGERQAHTISRAAWATSGLGLLVAVGLGAQGMMTLLHRRQEALQTLSQQEHTYQSLRSDIRARLLTHAQLENRVRQLQELALRRPLVETALQRLAETLPDELWLTAAELSKDDTALTGLVNGYSRSFQGVTRLIDQLKSSVGWTAVKPLSTTVTNDPVTGKELIAFSVQSHQPLKDPLSTPSEESSGEASAQPDRTVGAKAARAARSTPAKRERDSRPPSTKERP